MRHPCTFRQPRGGVVGVLLATLLAVSPTWAADPAAQLSTAGSCVLERQTDNSWRPIKPQGSVQAGSLIVALTRADFDTKGPAARLQLFGSLLDESPVEETAVIFHPAGTHDLDFTLDRGQVHVMNMKKSGPASVRVRFQQQAWEVILENPGDEIGLHLFGRHLPGIKKFDQRELKTGAPLMQLVLLAIKGEVQVKHNNLQHKLTAPPGAAVFHWDSYHGDDPRPTMLDKAPVWASDADPTRGPDAEKCHAALRMLCKRMVAGSVTDALKEGLASRDSSMRKVTVYVMSALDDMQGLGAALDNTQNADLRDNAVGALRHWLGRGPGQDEKLYNALIAQRGLTEIQAKTALQLLHSFDGENLARPETYELLIEYLLHPKLPARELARWHLYRLVPAGRNIPYDANGSEADRQKAYEAWKQLIPDGKLPPKPEKKNG